MQQGRSELAERYRRAYASAHHDDVAERARAAQREPKPAPPPAEGLPALPRSRRAPTAPEPLPAPPSSAQPPKVQPARSRSTAAMTAMPDFRTTLPFADKARPAPAPVAGEVASEAAGLMGQTGLLQPLDIDDGPLPFSGPRAPPPDREDLDETGLLQPLDLGDAPDPLPFRSGSAPRPAPAAEAVAAEAKHVLARTAYVPAPAHAPPRDTPNPAPPNPAPPAPALPGASLPPHLHALALEQVVALFVDAADAASRPAILARYGVRTPAELEQLRTHWNAQRRQSAAIRERWQAAHTTYATWKRQRGGA